MSDLETKRSTENPLKACAAQPLKAAAIGLFNALGYRTGVFGAPGFTPAPEPPRRS